ncbi:hypothetical protein [Maridesulfovibrio bastinii]|uniref:hypothetical protein n=1 Tax=Maridesulfovibrio bastinii TaxID=47157 RepID=UPI00042A795E|nr:hypothetical protein [Maridesulfovibrio bastinii]
MHFNDGQIPAEYTKHLRTKTIFILGMLVLTAGVLIISIGLGPVQISPIDAFKTVLGQSLPKSTHHVSKKPPPAMFSKHGRGLLLGELW